MDQRVERAAPVTEKTEKNKPKICIYCPYCYPIFNPQFKGHFGGWEVRASLIAKELAIRGKFDITIIVADNGQPQVEYREDVRLFSWVGKEFWRPPGNEPIAPGTIEAISNESMLQEDREKDGDLQKPVPSPQARRSFLRSMKDRLAKYVSGKTLAIITYMVRSLIQIARNFYNDNIEVLKIFLSILKTPLRPCYTALKELLSSTRRALYMQRDLWDAIDPNSSLLIWRKDVDILDQIDADIYIVPGNHTMSAITANYCEKRNKKFVFLAGSDMDYYPEFKTQPDGNDIYGEPYYLKTYAIEQADLHIVQTQRQADMLQLGFGRSAQIICNPIDLSSALARAHNADKTLWVGTSDERVKRPALVFELARRLPHSSFVVIMKCITKDDVFANEKAAQALPNVDLQFNVPFAEIEKYFADAKLFISTSAFEGFPNTFLQAAKYGVPIISTDVDPGNMLSQHGCGIVCGGDFERFVESVQGLMTNDDLRAKISVVALNYVRTYHDKDLVIGQYEKAFQEILTR